MGDLALGRVYDERGKALGGAIKSEEHAIDLVMGETPSLSLHREGVD